VTVACNHVEQGMEAIHKPTKRELITLMKLAIDLLKADSIEVALQVIAHSLSSLCPDEVLLMLRSERGDCRLRLNAFGAIAPIDQESERLFDALNPSEAQISPPTAHAIERKDGFLIAASFSSPRMDGRIAIGWRTLPELWVRLQALKLLPGIAELAGARLDSLMNQGRREKQLAAQCSALAATQTQHKEAMRHSELQNAEARELAAMDELTGLQNRRGFDAKAEQCLLLARRQALACAVIFVDVDGLKTVNDQLGHAVGDELIRCAGRIFSGAFRHADVVARVGGDEFAAFTFDNATPAAIVDRINRKVVEFNVCRKHPFILSLSIGVVTCDYRSGQSLSDYLERADEEMYRQKRDRLAQPSQKPDKY
jgi:diguanylate cyclase (GGDEF)-like protein